MDEGAINGIGIGGHSENVSSKLVGISAGTTFWRSLSKRILTSSADRGFSPDEGDLSVPYGCETYAEGECENQINLWTEDVYFAVVALSSSQRKIARRVLSNAAAK